MLKIMADDPLLRKLSIKDFLTYLHETNWRQVEYPGDRLIVCEKYVNGGVEPEMLALPKDPTYSDAYARLADAINLLAEIEGLPPYEVTQKILSTDSDTLCIRMLLPQGEFLSLENAMQIVRGLRDLIAFSASMEIEPKPFFKKPLPEGEQQAQLCHFGHILADGFGFTVEVPVYTIQPPLFEKAIPRRVVERIIRGLIFAQQAERDGNPAFISETYEKGLNSNMCRALAELCKDLGNIDIEFTISWSPRFPISQDLIGIKTIRMLSSAYYSLTEAAATLKQMVSPTPFTLINRRITTELDYLDSTETRHSVSTRAPEFDLLGSGHVSRFGLSATKQSSRQILRPTRMQDVLKGARAVADWFAPKPMQQSRAC